MVPQVVQHAVDPICRAIIPGQNQACAAMGVRILVRLVAEPRNHKRLTAADSIALVHACVQVGRRGDPSCACPASACSYRHTP